MTACFNRFVRAAGKRNVTADSHAEHPRSSVIIPQWGWGGWGCWGGSGGRLGLRDDSLRGSVSAGSLADCFNARPESGVEGAICGTIVNLHFSFRLRRIHMAPIYRVCSVIRIPTDGIHPWRDSWLTPFWVSLPRQNAAGRLSAARTRPGFPFPVSPRRRLSKWLLSRDGN